MRKLCLILSILSGIIISLPTFLMANNAPSYIERFKDIAIYEMHRSGIPASITLAQAIHESAWGNGRLAMNSNNYFGIKCKDYWGGPKYYIEDDDFKNGKLIKSCFRAYEKIEDSFKDHSDFLKDNPRYNKLFRMSITDYRAWAKGLQECGYATDKKYAQKIIDKIEKYQLHQYDTAPDPQWQSPQQSRPSAIATTTAPSFNISGFINAGSASPSPPQTIAQTIDFTEEHYEIPTAVTLPDDYQRGDNRQEDQEMAPLYIAESSNTNIEVIENTTAEESPEETIIVTYEEPQIVPARPQQKALPTPAPLYRPATPASFPKKEMEAIIRMTYNDDKNSAQLSRRPRVSNDRRR